MHPDPYAKKGILTGGPHASLGTYESSLLGPLMGRMFCKKDDFVNVETHVET